MYGTLCGRNILSAFLNGYGHFPRLHFQLRVHIHSCMCTGEEELERDTLGGVFGL